MTNDLGLSSRHIPSQPYPAQPRGGTTAVSGSPPARGRRGAVCHAECRPPALPGPAGDQVQILEPDAVTGTVQGKVDDRTRWSGPRCPGRIAALATGDPTTVVVTTFGPGQQQPDGSWAWPVLGAAPQRRLLDIALADGDGWRVIAPHAVYYRADWSDFGLAH